MKSDRVLVIGAGIIGLTTALCLRREGFEVVVVAESFGQQTTSVVAGALWEWPPAVCGYHHDQLSLERSKEWCMTSYYIFKELSQENTGVYWRPVSFYFKENVINGSVHYPKMEEIKTHVEGFRHDKYLISENAINPEFGIIDAYGHDAPMVDTDRYMTWLLWQVASTGCDIKHEKIAGNLAKQEQKLKDRFQARVIVNCAGLGSSELSGEYMYPLRGALVRLINDGSRIPKITKAFCVSHDESKNEQDIVFIVPRGENHLILGGLAEPDQYDLNINLENYEPLKLMYQRCIDFMPILADAEIDGAEPVRAGLRPFRLANVRLDVEKSSSIIHNYGHGGAGVSFSWGCALEVVEEVKSLVMNLMPNYSTY